MPHCPECGNEVSSAAKFCNNCGVQLSAAMSNSSIEPQESSSVRRRSCGACLEPVLAGAIRCKHCDEWLVPVEATGASVVLGILGWAWIVLSCLGALILWISLSDAQLPAWITKYGHGFVLALLLQGLVIGLAIVVFAERSPLKPRHEA